MGNKENNSKNDNDNSMKDKDNSKRDNDNSSKKDNDNSKKEDNNSKNDNDNSKNDNNNNNHKPGNKPFQTIVMVMAIIVTGINAMVYNKEENGVIKKEIHHLGIVIGLVVME